MSEEQDTRLREALRNLQPPPPGAETRERVRAAVAAAADAAAERVAVTPAAEPPRAGRRSPFAVFARHRRGALGLAVLTAVAVVAGVLLVGLPGGGGPEPVSASQILQRALRALSSGRTLTAELTLRESQTDTGTHYGADHYRFWLRADGSYRLSRRGPSRLGWSPTGESSHPPTEVAFDARRGVLSTYSPGWGLIERWGYPPGPPDRWAGIIWADFIAAAHTLQVSGATRPKATVYEGRPAWVLTCSMISGLSDPAITDQSPLFEITVDQATSFPVCFRMLQDGLVRAEIRYSGLRVNASLPDRVFELKAPAGAKVTRIQGGFRRAPLAQIARLPGYTTLVPTSVPRGFRLAQAAAAPHAVTANHLIRGRKVVALQYTRGFDSLTVTTRTVADSRFAAKYDPFEPDQSWAALVARQATISDGAFRGVRAQVVVAPATTTPHVWAVKDGVLLTVAGSASAEELLAIAASLRPVGR